MVSPPRSARHEGSPSVVNPRDARSARRPRPCANGQPYGRPARGDILGPGATLTSGAAACRTGTRQISTRHVPGRADGERRTPEAGRYPAGDGPGLHQPKRLGPILSAGTSGAASQVPRYRRSAARVLMDEGCTQSNAAVEGEDKFRTFPVAVIPAQAGIQEERLPSVRLWIPACAGMTGIALVFPARPYPMGKAEKRLVATRECPVAPSRPPTPRRPAPCRGTR